MILFYFGEDGAGRGWKSFLFVEQSCFVLEFEQMKIQILEDSKESSVTSARSIESALQAQLNGLQESFAGLVSFSNIFIFLN